MVELIEKKSKFTAYGAHIESELEAKLIIESLKREHKKAKHFAYAYVVKGIERQCDGGEPRRTAGSPILNAIKSRNLENVVVVVVRHFGGTLLGKGGLIRAYGKAASAELDSISIAEPRSFTYESCQFHSHFQKISAQA